MLLENRKLAKMKKKSSNMWLIVCLVVLWIILWIISSSLFIFYRKESFANSDIYIDNYKEEIPKIINQLNKKQTQCNQFFQSNSFCQWDNDLNKCSCKYQKDEIKYSFPSQPGCCDRLCSQIPKEKCLQLSDKLVQPTYYCKIGGTCYERVATVKNNQISANNCGTDSLNNQLLLPYTSKEECEGVISVCDKYNDPTYTESEKKAKCLTDNRCGLCTNKNGKGKCIEGTSTGPLDLQKYYYCDPSRTEGSYEYSYGDQAEALNITDIKQVDYTSNPNYLI